MTRALQDKAENTAEILAIGVSHALGDGDYWFVNEIVALTRIDSSIVYIAMYDDVGDELILFNPQGTRIPLNEWDASGTTFERDGVLHTSVPLQIEEGVEGALIIGFSLRERDEEIAGIRLVGLEVSIAIFVLGMVMSIYLSRLITKPLQRVVDTIKHIGRSRNYGYLIEESSTDEVGTLINAFNDMLVEIQGRDVALQKARDRLQMRAEELETELAERKRAEEAQRVAERQLDQQRALSLRSDHLRSLGEMAAGMAHELNQPLVGVRGLAEHILISIERGWGHEETLKERVSGIVEQADRMVHIIQHVRLFAREAGKSDLASVQLNEVVESSSAMLRAQFQSHGVELEVRLVDGLPAVMANPFSLEEVLLNLLNNARDAVEDNVQTGEAPEEPRVVLRTKAASNGKVSVVMIEVEDNGVGIPEDVLPNIFDPFFTTKGPDKGTGLGLSVSRSIVEEFGGTVQIRSTPGEGTKATICLPTAP